MDDEVITFVKVLSNFEGNTHTQLELTLLRIDTTISYFVYSENEDRKSNYLDRLQQLTDLFSHIFNGKVPRDFAA